MDEANQEMPSRLVRMKTAPPDVAPLLLTPEAGRTGFERRANDHFSGHL